MKTIEEKAKECTEELERLVNSRDSELFRVSRHGTPNRPCYSIRSTDTVFDFEGGDLILEFWPVYSRAGVPSAWERHVERVWRLLGLGIKND